MDKPNYYKKNREHIRNKYHNMTEEERQKYKEYQKNYRKNMTDEQKQRYREAKKTLLMKKDKNIKNVKKIIEKKLSNKIIQHDNEF